MSHIQRTITLGAVAVLLLAQLAALPAPAYAQDGPTPTPTISATPSVTRTPTAAPSKAPYKTQWHYEYQNAYLLRIAIIDLRVDVERGEPGNWFVESLDAELFARLLANTPHRKLQKVREQARQLYRDIAALADAWQHGTVTQEAALKSIADFEARRDKLMAAVERLFYDPLTDFARLWFYDLHDLANRHYDIWRESISIDGKLPDDLGEPH